MARLHTGGHGKSKSRKPYMEPGQMPEGLTLNKEQIEELIVGYAKQGTAQAQIGQTLKEKHGVPYIKQVTGKRLGAILKEKKLSTDLPADLLDLLKTSVIMRRHLAKNKKDVHNRTGLARIEAKIWRLTKYYKREGKLPQDWKYEPDKVALILKGV